MLELVLGLVFDTENMIPLYLKKRRGGAGQDSAKAGAWWVSGVKAAGLGLWFGLGL